MQYRNLPALLMLATVGLSGGTRTLAAPATPTVAPTSSTAAAPAAPPAAPVAPAPAGMRFQPEVLLMRSKNDGAEKSFDYAKLKPVTATGRAPAGVFRYRAESDVVTCTVKPAPPNARGGITTTIVIERESTDAGGHKNITTTSQRFIFTPGKSLIVGTTPHAQPQSRDTTVEILQLTLEK